MKIILDIKKCIGCGLCEENIPEIFKMLNRLAVIKKEEIPAELEQAVIDTIEDCPAEALSAADNT